MIEKPKRPTKIPNQDNKQPQTINELIRRYDLDNTKIYDYLDSLVLEVNNQVQTIIETQRNNLELMFPIGSRYTTQKDINPSEILGFGTWERIKGKVLIGLDEDDEDFNEIGKTGGEKTHTLTIDEMPKHNHKQSLQGGSGTGNTKAAYSWSIPDNQYDYDGYDLAQQTGGSQPHNNLQPYEVIGYMWIRRA